VPVPLDPPHSPHKLAWDRIRFSDASDRPLTANFVRISKQAANFHIQH